MLRGFYHKTSFHRGLRLMGQNTVFSQLIKLIPRTEFESWAHQYQGNKGVRSLDCWTWFGALLFGQMSGHDSIRAIERVFAHNDPKMQQLGFGPVRKSTLADANRSRPLEILEQAYYYTLQRAKAACPYRTGFRFNGEIFALDASTLELCLGLCPWARFDAKKASVRLHTAIDLAGELPDYAVIREGTAHEMRVARECMKFRRGATLIFDKGYSNYGWLSELNQKEVFFVTRARANCQFKVVESRPTDRTRGHSCDQTIYLKHQYRGKLRRIGYRDPDTGKKFVFLTNRFDLAVQTVCDLYKARWRVELFFKTLKQNLKIRKFLGNSFHAVKAQVWVALIAYLMIQILRFETRSSISMPAAMAVIGTLLLLKEPLSRLIGDLPRITRYPPASQLVLPI